MFSQRSGFRLSGCAALGLVLMAGCSQADTADKPPAVQALEAQGLTIVDEFEVGSGLRAFAAAAGDRPLAIYVTQDGTAIVGTRLDAEGRPLDEEALKKLVSGPLGDQTWAQLASSTWVLDGQADAPRIVYTFSDANCPYCHRFWEAARPWVDAGKVQLRHIMVGVIREDSPAKAAAILGAADPSAALRENEEKFDQGGIAPAPGVPDGVRQTLDAHQKLMLATGFRGTPGIVVRGDDGQLQKFNGMPHPAALAEAFGPL